MSITQRRLGVIVWFLISYFMLWFIPVALLDELKHTQNYTNGLLKTDYLSITKTLTFIFAFNVLFFIFDSLFFRIHKSSIQACIDFKWPSNATAIQFIFILCLLYGTVFYYLSTRNFSYTDYVENVASWPMVFLWCAGSGICLAALRKNYILAFSMTMPFLYFMAHLKIRSFALLSIIPLLIILYLQYSTNKTTIFKNWRIYLIFIPVFIALLFGGAYAMNTKEDKARDTSIFPDAGMPLGCVVIMEGIRKHNLSTGFNALILYAANISNPFRRLMGIHTPEIIDPPVVMAQIYEGFGKKEKTHYHYPVLWYTDAYLAFGAYGLILAIFWAAILNFWERLANLNAAMCCILFPAYSWHAYMLIRGAISGAAVPFLYSVYIAAIIFILFDYKTLLRILKASITTSNPTNLGVKRALFVTSNQKNAAL